MQVMLLRENEDGSADYAFDLTAQEREELLKYGILEALKNALRQGETLTVEGTNINES